MIYIINRSRQLSWLERRIHSPQVACSSHARDIKNQLIILFNFRKKTLSVYLSVKDKSLKQSPQYVSATRINNQQRKLSKENLITDKYLFLFKSIFTKLPIHYPKRILLRTLNDIDNPHLSILILNYFCDMLNN